MSIATVPEFVETLCRHRLLEPQQQEELKKDLAPHFQESRALAKELVARDWLTPYQVNQLFLGRVEQLLLGSYVLLERLGAGGMGEVFKARNWKLGQTVAIKLVRKERLQSEEAVRRFQREIQLAAKLDHPHIVRAFDADSAADINFFVMEYVEGIDLGKFVKKNGPLPVDLACAYVRQAALGLQHAHERGLVHRDIKPANLFLATKVEIIKVLDMGLARFEGTGGENEVSTVMTREGVLMGTPDYMAPEQVEDASGADIRADLYSLGCTLYYLLAGSVPYPGGTFMHKLDRHRFAEPTAIDALRPDVPPAVARIVRTLMAKKPAERYQTPAELAEALAACGLALAGSVQDARIRPASAKPQAADVAPSDTQTPGGATPASDTPLAPLIVLHKKQQAAKRPAWQLIALLGVSVAALVVLALLLRGWLFRAATPKGDDPVVKAASDKDIPLPNKVEPIQPADPLKFPPGPVTKEWIAAVQAQPAAEQIVAVRAKLKELNPNVDVSNFGIDKAKGIVTSVEISGGVTDLSPIAALKDLKGLACLAVNIANAPPQVVSLTDLSPLRGLKLDSLKLRGHRVEDLTPLEDLPLQYLHLPFTGVKDLTPLRKLPLKLLDLTCCDVADLTPLKGMKLEHLILNHTLIKDLAPLKNIPLNALELTGTEVADLTALQGMPLSYLNCSATQVKDLSPLAKLPLKNLWLVGTPAVSLAPLQKAPLEKIYCSYQPGRDAQVLHALAKLKEINGAHVAEFWQTVQPGPDHAAFVEQTAKLKPAAQIKAIEERLTKLNPGYFPKIQFKEKDGVVVEVSLPGYIAKEKGKGPGSLADLSPVAALTKVRVVRIGSSVGTTSNLWPLRGLPMESLEIAAPGMLDLSPLQGMFTLRQLSINTNIYGMGGVLDLAPLEGMKLTAFMVAGARDAITSLEPLRGMPLTSVQVDWPVRDLAPLAGLASKDLSLRGASVAGLLATPFGQGCFAAAIQFMPRKLSLQEIHIPFDFRHNAKTLAEMQTLKTINLKKADVFWKEQAALQVDFVQRELTRLNPGFDGKADFQREQGVVTELRVNSAKIKNLGPVATLVGLKNLYLNSDGPSSLEVLNPLHGLPLEVLQVKGTSVADLTPLSGMPLRHLYCQGTKVKDLTPLHALKTLKSLVIQGLPVDDLAPVQNLPLTSLELTASNLRHLEVLKKLPLTHVYVHDFNYWRDEKLLRPLKTLQQVNGKPAVKFWQTVDKEKADFELWRGKVAGLPPEEQVEKVVAKLKERNPGFTGGFDFKVKGDGVANFMVDTTNITDISPVRALKGLKELACYPALAQQGAKGKLANLWPLQGLKLSTLNVASNPVADLTPLQGMKLTLLNCHSTPVQDLAPLTGMPLTNLQLTWTKVKDLAPLKDMPLRFLALYGTHVADLAPLQGMPLGNLSVSRTFVQDLSSLKGLPLKELGCDSTKVTNLTPLQDSSLERLACDVVPWRDSAVLRSIKTLQTVNGKPAATFHAWADWEDKVKAMSPTNQAAAVGKKLAELNKGYDGKYTHKEKGIASEESFEVNSNDITDISPVRALVGLKRLSFSSAKGKLKDLSPLKGLSLSSLTLTNIAITDLEQLRGLKLYALNIGGTQVTDLTPLQGMPLNWLALTGTKVKDLTPVQGAPLNNLFLGNTLVQDLSPLKKSKTNLLDISYTPVHDLSPLADLPLHQLNITKTPVTDLAPLKGLPLWDFDCSGTNVTDLSPLELSPLKTLVRDFVPWRDSHTIRAIKTLMTVNKKPAKEFHAWADWTDSVRDLPTADQAEAVSAKLQELNKGFDGKFTHKAFGKNVQEFTFASNNVSDISPVRALRGLKVLKCRPTGSGKAPRGKLVSLAPLAGLPLSTLDIAYTPVQDLSPLRGMPLFSLTIEGTRVKDLSPLKDSPVFEIMADYTPIASLEPVAGMKNLNKLMLWDAPVSDLTPLANMKTLRYLDLENTKVTDLAPLANLKLLGIHIPKNVADLTPLENMPIWWIHVYGTKVNDLTVLKKLPLVQNLRCDFVPWRDSAIVRSLPKLQKVNFKAAKEFHAWANWEDNVHTLEPGAQVKAVAKKLKDLNPQWDDKWDYNVDAKTGIITEFSLQTDDIKDISPVRALPGLKKLVVTGSGPGKGQLADLRPLAHMSLESLNIRETKVTDLTPLTKTRLKHLECNYVPERDAIVLLAIPTLETINGKKKNEVLKAGK